MVRFPNRALYAILAAARSTLTEVRDEISGLRADSIPAGSNTIGKVDQGTGGASAWKVDGSAATQPVSGTVTANAGTGPFPVSDNGGSLTVDGAVTVSGTVTANAGSGPFPVSDNGGSLTVDGTVAVSGTTTTQLAASSASSVTSVAASASSVVLLAANAARTGCAFFNDSIALAYLKCGSAASLTSFTVRIASYGYYEAPANYSGGVACIWSSATGDMRVTEFSV